MPSISGASLVERAIGHAVLDAIDQHLHACGRLFAASRSRADLGGELHESRAALLLDLGRHRCLVQRVRGGTLDRRVLEAADAIEPRYAQPVEQFIEIRVGLPRESDDERAADRNVGHDAAPRGDPLRACFPRPQAVS